MIVSETPKRSNSRWLRACVLLCAMVVLPLGIASAQDYDAVERRLGEAVSKGELSLEQAGVMMDGLRRTAQQDGRAEYKGFERRIKAAVRGGKMTREEAGEKLEGFRRRMRMAEQDRGMGGWCRGRPGRGICPWCRGFQGRGMMGRGGQGFPGRDMMGRRFQGRGMGRPGPDMLPPPDVARPGLPMPPEDEDVVRPMQRRGMGRRGGWGFPGPRGPESKPENN